MPKEKEFQWPKRFYVIAWKGVGVEITKGWGSLLAKDKGMRLVVAPEVNSVNRFKWTGLRLFHITAGGTTETSQMIEADRKYSARDTGPFPVRAVWAQSRSHSGYFVRGDSKIKSIYDIKPGTRFSDMSHYVANVRIVEAFLAWAKVNPKDIAWVRGDSYKENVADVMEGRADVCFGIPTSPTVIEAEKNPVGIRWIDMNSAQDPEGANRFRAVDPLIDFGPMFNGVPSSIGRWGTVGTSLYLTHLATDERMVYGIAKWMHENSQRLKEAHSWGAWMNMETLIDELERTFIPVHPGLAQFLKENGKWTKNLETRSQRNADLIDRYCQAYQDCKDMADDKEIVIDPENPEWEKMWENYKKELGIPRIVMIPKDAKM